MSYLIYGTDTYRSREKLRAISQKYVDTNLGDTNLAHLDGAKAKADEIIRQLWIAPFLAPKRLVIVHNLISQGGKDVQLSVLDFLPKIPSTTLVIFYESEKIDKRNALFKALDKPKLAEEFEPLDPVKLRQWINRQFWQSQVKTDLGVVDFLAKNIGPDLWRLQNEIDKLVSFSSENITLKEAKELVHTEPSGDIFQLIDALAKRDIVCANEHLRGRLNAGDSPIYLFSMFNYGFRTLIIVKDALAREPGLNAIPGIHPVVFKKTANQIKSFSQPILFAVYEKLRDLDYDIKTGIIDPEVALDIFLFELCLGSLRG